MWLIFDRLWVRNALDEMQAVFSRNLEMLAELTEQLLKGDRKEAVTRIRQLQDQINAGFLVVNAQADAVLFEFGASRQRKLKIREEIRRWQPPLRTLLLVQITSAQYRAQRPLQELPDSIARALVVFEKQIALSLRIIANEVCGQIAESVPDIRSSAEALHQEVRKYYEERGLPVPTEASDVISLNETLVSILSPLSEDIHSTFARPR